MRQKFPRSVTDLIDQDYVHKLSPEEQAYLERFNDEFYGAAFTDLPLHPRSDRKDLYVTKTHRNEDLFTRGLRTGGIKAERAMEHDAEDRQAVGGDPASVPAYKSALTEFRALLPQDLKKKTRVTKEFRAVQAKIERITGGKLHMGGERAPANPAVYVKMAQTRLEKLEQNREIILFIGHIFVNHEFRGEQCNHVSKTFDWLEEQRAKVEEKIKGLKGEGSEVKGG